MYGSDNSMKALKQLLLVIIIKASLILSVRAQEETKCAGEPVKMTDHQKAIIAQCLTKVGIKTVWKIPPNKLSCFGVCVMDKKGMLTPEGKINHEKALNYIDMIMPDKVKKELIAGIDKCIKEYGQDVKANDDPKCMTFLHVGQCVHSVFLDICIE